MVDYYKSIARVVDLDPDDANNTATDYFPDFVAPRHSGNLVNVLYADAHVETSSPNAIDPSESGLHDTLWKP